MRSIPYGRQNISDADINAVVEVLKSDFLTQGPVVQRFEEKIAAYCGVSYSLAVNSATSGLHLACLALGVTKGDIVWTSPISFVASSNCALYCDAIIDFVDIDAKTYNMSTAALEHKLEAAEKTGHLPKVVIPVHLSGQSCDMKGIHSLSKKYGFKIIEDASHSIGASYFGKRTGSCEYSDITVFSFHPVKIITTGEGGAVLTNNADLIASLARLRSHGITRDPREMTTIADGQWYYQQLELGFNYRMSDIQAALGLSQIDRLDEFVMQRSEIASNYCELLSEVDVQLPFQISESNSSNHLYIIRVPSANKIRSRNNIFDHMRSAGIGVNLHYIPIYRQPYYSQFGFEAAEFPEAEKYYKEAMSIPIYPGLTTSDQERVVSELTTESGYQTIF